MTPDQVRARMEEAALTLRMLPDRERAYLAPLRSFWPASPQFEQDEQFAVRVQQIAQAIDLAPDPPPKIRVADPKAIERMEECWQWLRLIPNPKRRVIVWLRSAHLPVKRVSRIVKLDRRMIWVHHKAGLKEIADALNVVARSP